MVPGSKGKFHFKMKVNVAMILIKGAALQYQIIFLFFSSDISQAASSTVKLILMSTSNKFADNDTKRYINATKLPHLHTKVNKKFDMLPDLQKATVSPLLKIKKINQQILKESLFSFSFVRHPYTR